MGTDHPHDPHGHGHGDAAHGHEPINHETTDIHLDGVGKITIGFTVFMALTIGVMYGTFHFFGGRDAAGQRTVGTMVEQPSFERPALVNGPNEIVGSRTPAGPQLLTDEPLNLRTYRAEQTRRLESYGWVDRGGNVVHMPIARAIELIAERGLPSTVAEVATDEAAGANSDADSDAQTPETTAAPVPVGDPD
jgi:hypothetical protein